MLKIKTMGNLEFIPINIWDDFWDDNYIPEGETQETYIYVEDSDLSHEIRYDALQVLMKYIAHNIHLEGVRLELKFHDSTLEYPNLVGTEHEWCLYKRWEIKVENLTHKRLDVLVRELEAAKLELKGVPLLIYSES